MKILLTGATGLLGQAVHKALAARNHEVIPACSADFDVTDAKAALAFVQRAQPETIVHCAAYTAVDRAESEAERCMAVNAQGCANIARAAKAADAHLIALSSEYVFDGAGDLPHEADEPALPLNVYGMSKWLGEQSIRETLEKHTILRTSWVYGPGGGNFVDTMRRLGCERDAVRVVADQIGAPTYTRDLAELIALMAERKCYGTYHAQGGGECSFADLAQEVMALCQLPCRVERIASSEYPTAARRPLNSRLSMRTLDEAGLPRLPHWQDALARYLNESEA